MNVEMQLDNAWTPAYSVASGDPPGSLSNNSPGGRDMYIFGVDPLVNEGYIARFDKGEGTQASSAQLVASAGYIAIARLGIGESHELAVVTDISGDPRHIRFTYTADN